MRRSHLVCSTLLATTLALSNAATAALAGEETNKVPARIARAYGEAESARPYVCSSREVRALNVAEGESRRIIRARYDDRFDMPDPDADVVTHPYCPTPKEIRNYADKVARYRAAVRRLRHLLRR